MSLHTIIFAIIILTFLAAAYPLKSYQIKAHIRALKKSAFILGLSSIPGIGLFLVQGIKSELLYGELFIYTATFLAPVFYWFYERANDDSSEGRVIKGDWFTLVIALIVFALTSLFYGAFIFGSKLFIENYPEVTPYVMLGITVLLWYSIVAYDEDFKVKNFEKKLRDDEDSFLDEVTS